MPFVAIVFSKSCLPPYIPRAKARGFTAVMITSCLLSDPGDSRSVNDDVVFNHAGPFAARRKTLPVRWLNHKIVLTECNQPADYIAVWPIDTKPRFNEGVGYQRCWRKRFQDGTESHSLVPVRGVAFTPLVSRRKPRTT